MSNSPLDHRPNSSDRGTNCSRRNFHSGRFRKIAPGRSRHGVVPGFCENFAGNVCDAGRLLSDVVLEQRKSWSRILLPFAELALGLWIVSGVWLVLPSLVTTLMLGGFLTAMIRAYALGLEINCGCFGPGEKVGPLSFVRDGSFFALSLAVTIGAFLISRKKPAPQSSTGSTAQFEQAR